ncbi:MULTISPECIES: potassium-transporting ATPase subunit KdpC [unclassified Sporolactobacillus]|uniref:potassium-transporting ATPase subunit KdpC n=1 Tax=unclassified Sporolactobacillus TaxID=2628533 RepID=UPI00236773C2|nr:potassium-transporting ATPase subunit KdpC [Sporolactobacillus sp. CQH2019]MDD9149160.1 potassium-transporting ATPase subunit KdpC [Sporolactobacillus sp. CQH2019]
MTNVWRSIRVTVVFAVLLGLIYPLVIGLIGNLLFPYQAQGSMEKHNGTIVGSRLIAQSFTSARYFHSRPSAVDYAANGSAGSNLGPTNPALIKEIGGNIALVKKQDGAPASQSIPADMVETSGSGLDPDISIENARLQIPRIAKATGLSEKYLQDLVSKGTNNRFLGIFGEPAVNVLDLNLALQTKLGR